MDIWASIENSPNKKHLLLLVALTIPIVILTFVEHPLAQNPNYHHFADTRQIMGIPNFENVVSNLPFLVIGTIGIHSVWRRRRDKQTFHASNESLPYLFLFAGVALTAVGSAYYHLNPNNQHLVWDRLPMTIGFMGLFSATIMERINRQAGLWLLPIFLLTGIYSVFYWYWSELHNHGDLRLYIDVQFYPLIAMLLIGKWFSSPYRNGNQLYHIIGLYGLAKLFELLDHPIFLLTNGWLSGHTLKHLVAAYATYVILRVIQNRHAKKDVHHALAS